MSSATPLLELFKRGEAPRDVRLLAAQGVLAPRAYEQLAILMLLVDDPDADIRQQAAATLDRIPIEPLRAFLARSDVPAALRDFFSARGVAVAAASAGAAALAETDDPLIDTGSPVELTADDQSADAADASGSGPSAAGASDGGEADAGALVAKEGISQQLAKMTFPERLKAAVKGSREMRAILIRDPNKMISASVMSSPKLTDQEVESFARMANVSEDVLRTIAHNRSWMKRYGIVVGLTKNPKTPLAISLNLMARLNDRDLSSLSMDRNVPEPLRLAARKKLVAGTSRK